MFFSIYFRSDFTSGDETYTAGGETPIVGLLAFLSRSSECCGHTNFFFLQLKPNDLNKSRSSHKNNVSVTLISRLMPSSIDSKTLENTEKGFLYLQKIKLENKTQNENMKINVYFAALFLCNLALITHNAPLSVN